MKKKKQIKPQMSLIDGFYQWAAENGWLKSWTSEYWYHLENNWCEPENILRDACYQYYLAHKSQFDNIPQR